jgi:D-xylose 1-dehydrogenase (NADP+, D-xylono-1,5-lactone-forming)
MSTIPQQVRWGIMGVSKINNRLIPAFKASPRSTIQAIASRSLSKSQEAAQKDAIPKAYGSYEDLLNDPEIDAVYIPLPNHLHAEFTRKAADAGKHILCEKPLTPTAAECEALITYCRSKNVKLMDGFMWPHHPRTHAIRKLLDSNEIGRVERVVGAFTFLLEPLSTDNIRLHPEMAGGGLYDVGCYPVYGIRWAFQEEPVKVFAKATKFNGVDVDLTAILTFSDGRTASFDCGFTRPFRGWLEIVCTRGVIRIPEMWVPDPGIATYDLQHGENEFETIAVTGGDQIVDMIEDFNEAILSGKEVVPHPSHAIHAARIMEAILRSVDSGVEEMV